MHPVEVERAGITAHRCERILLCGWCAGHVRVGMFTLLAIMVGVVSPSRHLRLDLLVIDPECLVIDPDFCIRAVFCVGLRQRRGVSLPKVGHGKHG